MKVRNALIILVLAIIIGTGIKKYPTELKYYVTNILEITRLKNLFKSSQITYDYDLIIVGSGLAGLTAAFESNKLFKGEKKILLLEKTPKFGGNSAKATSGINMLNTPLQEKEGVKDSFEIFYKDTMKSGKNLSQPNLVSTVVNDSHNLFDFFTKEIGSDISKLGILGGHSVARTHRPTKETIGYHLVDTVYKKIKDINSIKIIFNATVCELITDEKRTSINGIKYYLNENQNDITELKTKSVILATGGFGHDFDSEDSLLKEFVPDKMKFPTTNGKQTQGIGMKIARNKGASLLYQRFGEIYPTCFVNLNDRFNRHKIIAHDKFRQLGAILINKRGKRFCDEMGTRRYVGQNILKNCDIVTDPKIIKQYEAFLIINEAIKKQYGEEEINKYINDGYLIKYKSFEDFAKDMNISEYMDNIKKSINNYNQAYEKKYDSFGKKDFPYKFKMKGKIYVGIVTPCTFHTLGGVLVSDECEIINTKDRIIDGLFAAGEIIGGVHGTSAMQGNILTQAAVFGRVAAKSAVDYIKDI